MTPAAEAQPTTEITRRATPASLGIDGCLVVVGVGRRRPDPAGDRVRRSAGRAGAAADRPAGSAPRRDVANSPDPMSSDSHRPTKGV